MNAEPRLYYSFPQVAGRKVFAPPGKLYTDLRKSGRAPPSFLLPIDHPEHVPPHITACRLLSENERLKRRLGTLLPPVYEDMQRSMQRFTLCSGMRRARSMPTIQRSDVPLTASDLAHPGGFRRTKVLWDRLVSKDPCPETIAAFEAKVREERDNARDKFRSQSLQRWA